MVEKLVGMMNYYKLGISHELKFSIDSYSQLMSSHAIIKILRKLGWEATTSLEVGPDKMIADKLDGQP